MTTAKAISDAFLHLALGEPSEITNLKLQKLLYYAQAWHLVFHNKVLFRERIEAWVHGPVVPEIFRMYKHLKWNPIPDSGACIDSKHISDHLKEVWKTYGKFTATQLEMLTHREDPWKQARAGLPPDVSSSSEITTESMKAYYSSLT
jgi:uncharacterized phage-associated protein